MSLRAGNSMSFPTGMATLCVESRGESCRVLVIVLPVVLPRLPVVQPRERRRPLKRSGASAGVLRPILGGLCLDFTCSHLFRLHPAAMATRLSRPAPSMATLHALESALASFRISTPSTIGKRFASHQAQGRANKAKQGPGKRLGSKKLAGEYVVTGNILYKQRGTLWYPGDNCFMV